MVPLALDKYTQALDPRAGMFAAAAKDVQFAVTIHILDVGNDRVKSHALLTLETLHLPGFLDTWNIGPVILGDLEHIHADDFTPLVLADCPLARRTKMHVEC